MAAIHGRHDGRRASPPSSKPPGAFRSALRSAPVAGSVNPGNRPIDRGWAGREQGRRGLERDGEQLGFATIKILGHQVRGASVDKSSSPRRTGSLCGKA